MAEGGNDPDRKYEESRPKHGDDDFRSEFSGSFHQLHAASSQKGQIHQQTEVEAESQFSGEFDTIHDTSGNRGFQTSGQFQPLFENRVADRGDPGGAQVRYRHGAAAGIDFEPKIDRELKRWAQENELRDETLLMLAGEDYTTLDRLKKLTKGDIEVLQTEHREVPRFQFRQLEDAVLIENCDPEFKSWLREWGLSQETITELLRNNLCSKRLLADQIQSDKALDLLSRLPRHQGDLVEKAAESVPGESNRRNKQKRNGLLRVCVECLPGCRIL